MISHSYASVSVFNQCSHQSKPVWSSHVAEQATQQYQRAATKTNSTSIAKATLSLCQVTKHVQSATSRPTAWEAPGDDNGAELGAAVLATHLVVLAVLVTALW